MTIEHMGDSNAVATDVVLLYMFPPFMKFSKVSNNDGNFKAVNGNPKKYMVGELLQVVLRILFDDGSISQIIQFQ